MPNLLVTATTRYDPKGLNKAKKDIKGFDKTIKSLGKTFLGLFAAQKMLAFGKASVKAFVADDKAVRMLGNSLKNIGASYAATGVEDFIAKLQKTTGVLDDALRPALQILLTATGDVTKSQNALALALDVSQATGKDLSAVSTALAKGFQGNTTALAKMGGAVSKATLATGDMNKITAELTAKYKGSALTAMTGYAGQMAKLGVASANVKEILGKGLLDALSQLGDSNSVQDTADAMETLAQNTADVIRGIGILAGKLKSIPLFNAIVRTLGDSFSAGPVGTLMRLGQSKIKTGYGQQSPGDRNLAVATNKKLQLQKAQELAALLAKNKATKEEAQMKKDQAALDALKAKFDLERIGLNAALLNATDEETKARIRAQIAILDETGKTAQAANDALVKAQADKVTAELAAASALNKLATATGLATTATGLATIALGMYRTALSSTAVINKAETIAKMDPVLASNMTTAVVAVATPAVTAAAATPAIIATTAVAATAAVIATTAVAAIIAATETTTTAIANTATAVAAIIAATDNSLKPGDFASTNEAVMPENIFQQIDTTAFGALIDAINSFASAKDGGITVTINDNTSGLIEIVQDAVVDNTRNGNNLFVAGSI